MPFISLESDQTLTVLSTTFQAVNEQFKRGTRRINRNAINLVSKFAERNFRDSIIREEHSVTLGGSETYQRSTRASGKFTFGPGGTFTGSLLKNLGPNISGFGYPIIERAEKRTNGAWRALEFGRPAFTMPPGFWIGERQGRDSRGRFTQAREGVVRSRFKGIHDRFAPTPRGPEMEARGGIQAKQFITTAFEDVVDRYVEPEYRKLAEKVARDNS